MKSHVSHNGDVAFLFVNLVGSASYVKQTHFEFVLKAELAQKLLEAMTDNRIWQIM